MTEHAGHAATESTPSPGVLDTPWAFWAMAALATLVGAWLRLHALEQPSFWVDEFFTIGRAGRDPLGWRRWLGYLPTRLSLGLHGAELSQISIQNIEAWRSLGVTERGARLGPCWVGIATVPLVALLARRVVGGAAAGIAALLLAITPWHLYWSQMARFYTTQFLFTSVFVLALARGVQTGGRRWFWLAGLSALLAYLSHLTALFVVAASFSALALAAWLRWHAPGLRAGLLTVVGIGFACAALFLLAEFAPLGASSAFDVAGFADQDWDPSLRVLRVGAVLRIEPVVFVVGIGAAVAALRRRDVTGVLFAGVALGVPAIALLLNPIFPIGPRYFFPCLYAWTLLAGLWAVDVERQLRPGGGLLAGLAGAGAVLVAVGANAYLYAADGSGQRERWREAFAFVQAHAEPGDPVIAAGGRFQARYYPGRALVRREPPGRSLQTLEPGSWLIHRRPRPLPEIYSQVLDLEAHFEIPSKPWSRSLWVLRAPERAKRAQRAASRPARSEAKPSEDRTGSSEGRCRAKRVRLKQARSARSEPQASEASAASSRASSRSLRSSW